MANPRRYGFQFARSFDGNETPQTITKPVASGYQPNTGADGTGGTNCNLNPGDPVQLLADGTVRLVQPGQATDGTNIDDRTFGVVVGFPRVMIGGAPRPNGFLTGGTTYSGDDQQTLVTLIPVHGNIFTVQCDAPGQPTTKTAWQSITGVANFIYSVLTAGAGQPKANPLLDISTADEANALNQLRVVGLSKHFDQEDPTLEFVTLEVIFNQQQLFPTSIGNALTIQPGEGDLEA